MKRERDDDADEGEIRAPPRNGMAMYEILSIPSHTQGLNQSSFSSDFFLPSALSKQGSRHDRTVTSRSTLGREPLNLGFRVMATAAESPLGHGETKSVGKFEEHGDGKSEESKSSGKSEQPVKKSEETKSLGKSKQHGEGKSEDIRSSEDEGRNLCSQTSTASRRETLSDERSGSVDGGRDDANGPGTTTDEKTEFNISPDDIVGLIGTKYFWKLRKAIADQQRIFKTQVFELHRLMEVQELLSGSPDLLLADITPLEAPVDDSSDFLLNPPMQTIKEKKSTPLPWCSQMMGENDDWLFSAVPPAEGLIYKPHPHTPEVISTNYCGSPSAVPAAREQISTGLAVSGSEVDQLRDDSWSSNQEAIPKNRPFSENSRCSGSNPHVERNSLTPPQVAGPLTLYPRVSPLNRSGPSTPLLGVFLEGSCPWTPLPWVSSMGNSGPSTTLPRVSPLEDTDPFTHWFSPSDGPGPFTPLPRLSPRKNSRQQSEIIRVVPHDPKSTTESAVRIFQHIQKERQQHNSEVV